MFYIPDKQTAEQLFSDGVELYAVHEMDEKASLVTSLEMLAGYSPECLFIGNTFTAFCQEKSGRGTIWIEAVKAHNVEHAIAVAREECAEAWEKEPEDIHVLGIAEGDITILHWEDLDA